MMVTLGEVEIKLVFSRINITFSGRSILCVIPSNHIWEKFL